MALGSWQGVYNAVIEELMEQRRESELLLLLAIARHCDPFGFCYPGRKNLMRIRHCKKEKLLEREKWLQERGYIVVVESYDYRRRQPQFDYQVSPRAIYVRDDIQLYCEAVFDAQRERDYQWESSFLGNLFSTKDSQPESHPESETRRSKPDAGTSPMTRKHNQLPNAAKGKQDRPPAGLHEDQRRETPKQKDNPPTGGDEFAALLSPDVDDDRIADEIRLAVATTLHQARDAVNTYPREGIVHWLRHTALRRAKGELKNPGGYFFRMLKQHVAPAYEMP